MKNTQRCPLCKNDNTEFFLKSHNRHGRHDIDKKDTFRVCRCNICKIVFIADIKINSSYYKKYYDTGYYDSGAGIPESFISKAVTKLETWSLSQKEAFLLRSVSEKKQKLKILDVGCGNGKFLGSLNPQKFEKYGIEINQEGIKLSRKQGFTIYEKDITEIDFGKKKFDIVTLWHVLEHLLDPIGVFKKVQSILSDDGIVLFATPNTDSLGFKIGKSHWFHLDSPRHLMLFNMKSADYLCENAGLKIESSINEFYDYPLDLFWSVKGTPNRYLIYPLYPIVKYFDREALTVICRKVA